jgi:dihydrodipicolinate synthase/N-acetylneuraminate lyase
MILKLIMLGYCYAPRSADGVFDHYQNLASAVDIGICVYSSTLSELGYYITPPELLRGSRCNILCVSPINCIASS